MLVCHTSLRPPYISMLTHPSTAGVMANYASLGDLILAEPGAMIGYAGSRVIKDTTQAELPPGFQTAEFLVNGQKQATAQFFRFRPQRCRSGRW